MTPQLVSILVPALNEERHIEAAIRSIEPRDDQIGYEIVVLDGGSTDRTRSIVAELAQADPRIRLVANPGRLQSAALNLGAQVADPRAEVIIRADSHAIYPPDFVSTCLRSLKGADAQSVVVTMVTKGVGWFQRGAAAAQNSLLGNGASSHRRPGESRYVDHGHHAAFDRAFFLAVGGYDEALIANEDVDLDARIIKAGGKIWLETSVPVTYFPRATIRALGRQYFRYGRGRALTWRRHGYRLRLRQLAPVAILCGNLTMAVAAFALGPAPILIPLAYVTLCLGWGFVAAVRTRDPALAVSMGAAAMTMHHAWAVGFASGVWVSRAGRGVGLGTGGA